MGVTAPVRPKWSIPLDAFPSVGAVLKAVAVAGTVFVAVSAWVKFTPRGATPPPPAHPVVSLDDTPGDAMVKSHVRYMLNFADSLEEFAKRADTFEASGDAAAWFKERTERARKDAFSGDGSFDAYVFGHAGGTSDGEDRYDPITLAKGAREMAAAGRKAAAQVLSGQR